VGYWYVAVHVSGNEAVFWSAMLPEVNEIFPSSNGGPINEKCGRLGHVDMVYSPM
jgi:hypothetical protein